MRLFFASWPPPAVAQALALWARGLRQACGGRATAEEKIHLTLAFLGDAEPESALATARGVHCVASALVLTQARYWAHNRIVWVGPEQCPASLSALARDLGGERGFAAHVTLIRKARAPERLPALPALEWPVEEFLLVRSDPAPEGSRYSVLDRFALR